MATTRTPSATQRYGPAVTSDQTWSTRSRNPSADACATAARFWLPVNSGKNGVFTVRHEAMDQGSRATIVLAAATPNSAQPLEERNATGQDAHRCRASPRRARPGSAARRRPRPRRDHRRPPTAAAAFRSPARIAFRSSTVIASTATISGLPMSTPVVLMRGTHRNGIARMNPTLSRSRPQRTPPVGDEEPGQEDAGNDGLDHSDAGVAEDRHRQGLEEREAAEVLEPARVPGIDEAVRVDQPVGQRQVGPGVVTDVQGEAQPGEGLDRPRRGRTRRPRAPRR